MQVAAHRGQCGIEIAAAHVRKLDLGRIRLTQPDSGAAAEPKVEIGGEARLRQVQSGNLVEGNAGIDARLQPREASVSPGDPRACETLIEVRVHRGYELQGCRFKPVPVET